MKISKHIISGAFAALFSLISSIYGQQVCDTTLFTIHLKTDTNSLFCCKSTDDMRTNLSGPVFMENKTLLFYSQNGYVLYSQNGAVLDSQSLFKENKRLSINDPKRLVLIGPLDKSTLLYFKKNPFRHNQLEILEKKLYKNGLRKCDFFDSTNNKELESSQIFNIAHNTITDELIGRTYLVPNCVGYSSVKNGVKWWCLDKFISFVSPVIVENNGTFVTYFPGILHDQKTNIQKQLINQLATFVLDGRYYYYGIHTPLGSRDSSTNQEVYLCDQVGNVLYKSEILKQVIVDAILEFDKKSNTNYTVKRPGEYVFSPTISDNGDMYYGTIRVEQQSIEVKKRFFFYYTPVSISPEHEDVINKQRLFSYKPVKCNCAEDGKINKVAPDIQFRSENGKKTKAQQRESMCNGYSVFIERECKADSKKKLSQRCSAIPQNIKHMQDSLSQIATATCPYSIVLEKNDKEIMTPFYFGIGDTVLCARVIAVAKNNDVYVRVDATSFADIIIFSQEGSFVNRFMFNKQNFKKRKDIIAVAPDGDIIEEDYEAIVEDYVYFRWVAGKKIQVQMKL